jgi:hypothetical protein
MALGDRLRSWGRWGGFFIAIYIYMSSCNSTIPIPPLPVHPGRQEWVNGMQSVWMTFCLSYLRVFHDQ